MSTRRVGKAANFLLDNPIYKFAPTIVGTMAAGGVLYWIYHNTSIFKHPVHKEPPPASVRHLYYYSGEPVDPKR